MGIAEDRIKEVSDNLVENHIEYLNSQEGERREMKTEECKNEIARNNNFDSFERAVRYTFNRELLQSEKDFINKIINESIQLYAEQQQKFIIEMIDEKIKGYESQINGEGLSVIKRVKLHEKIQALTGLKEKLTKI